MKRSVLTFVLIGLGSICLFFVWLRLDLVRVGYSIERLEKRKATLAREYDALQLSWSQLTSPQRIAQEATEKLGLGTPKPGQVVMVTVEPVLPVRNSNPTTSIQLAQSSIASP